MIRTSLVILALGLPLLALSQTTPGQVEAKALEVRAEAVTKKIGELATSGKLPTSEEGIVLLRKLVDELSEIRERLTALEGNVGMVMKAQVPQKTMVGGYIQFQYRGSDQVGQNDGFQIRRARVNITHQADPRTFFKLSADFATGPNQLGGQLKDAYAQVTLPYDLQATGGQFVLPLSYQLTIGDTDRAFPERTAYMNAIFNGERSRGAMLKGKLGGGATAFVGAVNAETIGDTEQANIAAAPGSALALMGGIGYSKDGLLASATGFGGKRASTTNGGIAVPKVDRHWLILNAGYDNVARTPFSIRGEYMTGKDRLPGASTAPLMNGTNMRAWSMLAGYHLTEKDNLFFQYENWNRNTANSGFSLRGFGLTYFRDLTPAVRLVGTWERYSDDMLPNDYSITTVRLQYRF
ncbi:hypothetical protein BH11ARM1_BH11ARM1_06320 [soil metagenome]